MAPVIALSRRRVGGGRAQIAPRFHRAHVPPELRVARRIAGTELGQHDVEAATATVILAVANRFRCIHVPAALRLAGSLLAIEAIEAGHGDRYRQIWRLPYMTQVLDQVHQVRLVLGGLVQAATVIPTLVPTKARQDRVKASQVRVHFRDHTRREDRLHIVEHGVVVVPSLRRGGGRPDATPSGRGRAEVNTQRFAAPRRLDDQHLFPLERAGCVLQPKSEAVLRPDQVALHPAVAVF